MIKQNSRKVCKCHGMSGSCQLKTCWNDSPPIRHVGYTLKQHYNQAVQVRSRLRKVNCDMCMRTKRCRKNQMYFGSIMRLYMFYKCKRVYLLLNSYELISTGWTRTIKHSPSTPSTSVTHQAKSYTQERFNIFRTFTKLL